MPMEDLGTRLSAVVNRMRAEGQLSVETFIASSEAGTGGTLVIQAPCGKARMIPEAGFRSERWKEISA